MLDVHPPHAAVHGWRDFFIHIATITLGLVIALGLEGLVEYLHHRHIVAEARENIRVEIGENHRKMVDNQKSLQEDTARIKANLATHHSMRAAPKTFKGHLDYTIEWSSLNDSAWRSARDMGALQYMPLAEVQNFDELYHRQELVDGLVVPLMTREVLTVAPMVAQEAVADTPIPDIDIMLHDTAAVSLSLEVLSQTSKQLDDTYIDRLKN